MNRPYSKYDQIVDGTSFIHESGKHLTQACCDCGSAHNIKLTVLNEEEIEVEYYKNKKATADFRAMTTHGVLISDELSRALPEVLRLLQRGSYARAKAVLNRALKEERGFQQLYASGDFLG